MQYFIVNSLIVDLGNENKNWNNTVGNQKELLERIISKFKSIMYSSLNMKFFKTTWLDPQPTTQLSSFLQHK